MTTPDTPFPTLKPRTPGIVVNSILLLLIVSFIFLQKLFNDQMDAYVLRIVLLIGLNIILAVSLNLINGITGQFSLGHAGFMAVGAYASAAFTTLAWPGEPGALALAPALLVGGTAAACAGLIVGIPPLRLRGDYLAIVTLGFGEIIRVVILNTDAVGGARGFSPPVLAGYSSVFSCAIVCIVVIWRLVHSVKGCAFAAIREDEIAAGAMGINTTRYKIAAFTLGAFWAGVAGALSGHFVGYLHTNSFQFLRSIEIVVMVVLGGMGSISGAIISAITLTILPEALRGFKEYRMVVYPALLIVTMLTRPTGLLGSKELDPWRYWKLKTARSASAD
jgi:branched-chain amino acid transport system permease protein